MSWNSFKVQIKHLLTVISVYCSSCFDLTIPTAKIQTSVCKRRQWVLSLWWHYQQKFDAYIWHYQKKVSLSIKLFQVWKAVCLKTCNFLQKLLKMPSMQIKLQLQGTFLKGHAWSCLCNLSDQSRFLGNCPPTPPLSHHFALSER